MGAHPGVISWKLQLTETANSLNKKENKKGNFPLAECNEISLLTHPGGPGYRSCDQKMDSCFCCVCPITDLPTHPP